MRRSLWLLGLVVLAFAATACTEKLNVAYVNNTNQDVLVTLDGDGPITVEALETNEVGYGPKSMFDEPYEITIQALDGTVLLQLALSDEELDELHGGIEIQR